MEETNSNDSPSDVAPLVDSFFRLTRHDPDSRPTTHEIVSLEDLRAELDLLLTDLEPGEVQIRPNAVTLTGKRGGADVLATVQLWVAQPTSPWAEAAGGSYGDWSGWIAVMAKKRGWPERRKPA